MARGRTRALPVPPRESPAPTGDLPPDQQEFLRLMSSPGWRLDHLYMVTNKRGQPVRFVMNWAQAELARGLHYRNLVLKARQLGITTFACMYGLDRILFRRDERGVIIAHNLDFGQDTVFRDKLKYAYAHLDPKLREARVATKNEAGELMLDNNSSMKVTTSARGGTVHFLHVTEYAAICNQYPDKAKEIRTGAIEAVPRDGVVILESTAAGNFGDWYELCMAAAARQKAKREPGQLDWKLHFFPWYREPEYTLELSPDAEPLPKPLVEYFAEFEHTHGVKLTDGQKAWYRAKKADLGDDVFQEYPATVEEAFQANLGGAYFRKEILALRGKGKITKVPYDEYLPVDTWWDLGVGDDTSIWFTQDFGREVRVIDFYANSGEGLLHYADMLKEKGYRYGKHVGPHDMRARELTTGVSRWETAAKMGLRFECVPRLKKEDTIQAARRILPMCVFDEHNCAAGIECLERYRREWDEKGGTYKDRPLHDKYSHGADAFQTFAVGHDMFRADGMRAGAVPVQAASVEGFV